MPDGSSCALPRTQEWMFLVLVTDAVAAMYPGLGLQADQPLSMDVLKTRMAQAGLLDDAPPGDC